FIFCFILLFSLFFRLFFFFFFFFFFNDTATTEIYTLSLHDALPILRRCQSWAGSWWLHASRPSVARRRSRNAAPVRAATPRSASDSAGNSTVRPHCASARLYGQPCAAFSGIMRSVTGAA